jgi:broad specificity phosphatase PhoE
MKADRLFIAMVGLPARGKSTIATRLRENLSQDGVKTKIFNNGKLRRKMIKDNSSYARFFDPKNQEGVALREKIAWTNLQYAQKFLDAQGQVAILDATNVSIQRRRMIQTNIKAHPLLFVECINRDEEILEASILRKIDMPEFGHLTQAEAIASFKQRIAFYEAINEPLMDENNYVQVDSLNNRIIGEEISNSLPYYDQIRDFLVADMVKHLYLIRHGETYFNLENRIGGDSSLTSNGLGQAKDLARYFQSKVIPIIFTSQKKRTIETAEPIRTLQNACTIIPLAEFNEIDSGICECMSYEEIRREMPEVYGTRKQDKYNYAYPGGEGYVTMEERIDRGIKKALYLSDPSDKIMIVGHRAANRMILSHFLFRRKEDVPYIYIPQDRFYYIRATHNKKLFQLMRYV